MGPSVIMRRPRIARACPSAFGHTVRAVSVVVVKVGAVATVGGVFDKGWRQKVVVTMAISVTETIAAVTTVSAVMALMVTVA